MQCTGAVYYRLEHAKQNLSESRPYIVRHEHANEAGQLKQTFRVVGPQDLLLLMKGEDIRSAHEVRLQPQCKIFFDLECDVLRQDRELALG